MWTYIIYTTKVKEHKGCDNNQDDKSVIAIHSLTNSHNFNFDRTKVLANGKSAKKVIFLEMLNIQFFLNTLKITQDIHFFKKSFKNTISLIKG